MTKKRNVELAILATVLVVIAVTAVVLIHRHRAKVERAEAVGSFVQLEGTLQCDEVDVSSKIPGRISRLLVQEGDLVQAGQVIGWLESKEVDAKVAQASGMYGAALTQTTQATTAVELQARTVKDTEEQAKAGYGAAAAKLDMAVNGARPQEIEQAQKAVEAARASYETAANAYNDQVQQAEAGQKAAQAKLDMALNGARPQEIVQAQKALEGATAAYDTASATYRRFSGLYEKGVIPKQKQDEIELQYLSAKAQKEAAEARLSLVKEGARKEEVEQARQGVAAAAAQFKLARDSRLHLAAKANYEAAQAKLRLVKEGARKEEIRQAKEGVSAARAQLQMAKDSRLQVAIRKHDVTAAQQKSAAVKGQLDEALAFQSETRIVAPISGYISERMSNPGEMVSAGFPILTIVKSRDFKVKVYADETKFGFLKLNDSVHVTIPALGNRQMTGTIVRIGQSADFATRKATNELGSFDVRAVEIVIRVANDPALRNGMTARVRLPVEVRSSL